ncbi:hypothetical protein [Mumia zhuanghuii]|uniref:hypothetical protein n=1 Tax=Mumia zhuanghuii TaxID=2585211 RepID=UPI00129C37B7|nr:hypothetical protein [Mumia zhuanghuii]
MLKAELLKVHLSTLRELRPVPQEHRRGCPRPFCDQPLKRHVERERWPAFTKMWCG